MSSPQQNSHLTRKQLTKRVAFWKDALGLREWQIAQLIEVPETDDGTTALMSIHRHSKYRDAVLRVHPWCVGESDLPEHVLEEYFKSKHFLEYKIVHELLHLVLRDLVHVQTNTLDGYLHRDVQSQYDETTDLEEERTVDALARALVVKFGKFPDT